MRTVCLGFIVLLFASVASEAAQTWTSTKVKSVTIYNMGRYAPFALVDLVDAGTGTPAECVHSANLRKVSFDPATPTGEAALSLFLSARLAGQEVFVQAANSCTFIAIVASLATVRLGDP